VGSAVSGQQRAVAVRSGQRSVSGAWVLGTRIQQERGQQVMGIQQVGGTEGALLLLSSWKPPFAFDDLAPHSSGGSSVQRTANHSVSGRKKQSSGSGVTCTIF
jgi:hypothetical protein